MANMEGSTMVGEGNGAVWFGEPKTRWQTIGWLLFTLTVCLHFALTYSAIPDFLNLDAYMRGVERTPYQYRILMMWVFQLLATKHAVLAATAHVQRMHVPDIFKTPQQLVQIAVAFISMFGAVLATAATLTKLTGDRIFSRWMSLVLIYMAYFNLAPAGWELNYTYPYDVPSLMFFCLAVYLVISGKDWAYYVLFPIATLNRETTCFLTIFMLVWKWRELKSLKGELRPKDWLTLAAHGVVQIAIWMHLKAWLAHHFAGNQFDYGVSNTPAPASQKLLLNLHMMVEPQQWPVFLSLFGFLLPAIWLGRRWIRNEGISWGLAIMLPLWALGMLLVGVIGEIRVFSELSALLAPALGLIVYHRFRPVVSNSSIRLFRSGSDL
jgi:hypothetical protein